MTKAIIKQIPLDKLVVSPLNVRKTKASESDDAELRASIKEQGLKQNLLVHPIGDMFHVHAGGRRLEQLQALAGDGVIKSNVKVPCLVETMEDAIESSTAENTNRTAMHPADQFVAFSDMIEQGRTVEEIAVRFGASADLVRRRLKLAKVAPELLEAFREDEMTLDCLMAFTVSDDHARQIEVWQSVSQSYSVYAHSIRNMLTEETYSANSRFAKFVGLETYEAAGGTVLTDLFSDHNSTYLEDKDLLEKLVRDKIEAEAEELRSIWKWVEVSLDVQYHTYAEYDRVYPQPVDVDPALITEQEELTAKLDDLESNYDEESRAEELQDEEEKLRDRLDEVETQIRSSVDYTDEQCAIAGCIVSINHEGKLKLEAGLVRPEDIRSAQPQTEEGEGDTQGSNSDGSEVYAFEIESPRGLARSSMPVDPVTAKRKSQGVSMALADDLRAIRHQVLQAHLSADYETAFDAMLYTMAKKVLNKGYGYTSPLDVSFTHAKTYSSKDVLADTIAAQMLGEIEKSLNLGWLELDVPEDFKAMSELPAADKQAIFAWCSAYSLSQQLSTDTGAMPVFEYLGERMQVDVAKCWRPTADNYWSRVNKTHCLNTGREQISDNWANERSHLKKAPLAKSMERAFAEDAREAQGLDPDAAARTSAWLPDGLAFVVGDQALTEVAEPAFEQGEADVGTEPGSTNDEVTAASTGIPAFLEAAE